MKFQTFGRQDDKGFICFLLMRDVLYVQIPKNDISPPFSCSIISLCSVFPANRNQIFATEKSDFCPFICS